MTLSALLAQREADGRPIRVGLVGAGKLGGTWLAQARRTPGVHVVAVADLRPDHARLALARAGFAAERCAADDVSEAARLGTTWVGEDAVSVVRAPEIEIVVEATGSPAAGVRHALACAATAKSLVMANAEADALAGPLLAERVRQGGGVYSLANGDQPALVCALVDWARASGFDVVAAGKGTRFLPRFRRSTPETVWADTGVTPEQAAAAGLNARRYNAVLDGTKSAVEMAIVANATGLDAPPNGLGFHPCGARELPRVLRPEADGGVLARAGQVEVVSSIERDGAPVPDDLRHGVFVVIAASSRHVATAFGEHGVATDDSGRYAALWRPAHLAGLELGVSVASAALRGESTGEPVAWRADVIAVARRDLAPGAQLDGEGGYAVYGRLVPAEVSRRLRALPIGLATGVPLVRAVAADAPVTLADVALDEDAEVVRVRREMELLFG
ncbi:NAD(P)H-dependent oxidoreductase [Anaeromyxobacter oryzae]|uniref:Flagellar protein FlgA n=1 Tax=Anaeromyxobacter oryzae TaxID=2918170 RepID=A0ABM7X1V0_9BACT|nr:SAF domain-containing protein [Anaeromyxobacter oryzae]BDG05762.1 flagellar protein FlgA [Anaeromyxobacter oryzae]